MLVTETVAIAVGASSPIVLATRWCTTLQARRGLSLLLRCSSHEEQLGLKVVDSNPGVSEVFYLYNMKLIY